MAGSNLQVPRPMSVKEVSANAQDFDFNPFIALKYWLRTAETLLREARIYEQEDNDQQTYLLLMRYANLVMEKLPLHPTAKDPETKAAMKAARGVLPEVLNQLEGLRPRIDERFNKWQKSQNRKREATEASPGHRPGSRSWSDMATSDPAVAGNVTTLGAAENSHLAVKLAHKEIKRRDAKRKATRQAGVSEEEEQERRTAGLWDDWEAALSRDGQNGVQDEEDMRRQMEDSKRRLDGQHGVAPEAARRRPSQQTVGLAEIRNGRSEYRYPSITRSQPLKYEDGHDSRSTSNTPPPTYAPPNRPSLYRPPKPPKENLYDEPPPTRPEKSAPESLEPVMDDKAPPSFTFRPSAYLENGKPLRTVFLPPDLRHRFLQLASANTRNNLETCGMLCGTLISNALFISRLIIPEQKSTSDTCETMNESAFFDYCASEDLMVLGWIHTHPTQTCFMSSRDLHTHCGYQIMMPESIAIVCAPSKNPSWGVFRLTDPPGMQSVLNCRQTGLFHPHNEPNIYTDALRPGHVFEAEGLEFQVVDMRPKTR